MSLYHAFSQQTTIASGSALGDALLNLGNQHLVGISMPAAWTAAALTFQHSLDGSAWQNCYDQYGAEISLTVAADTFVVVPPLLIVAPAWLRVRSGTSASPVNQAADRTLTLRLQRYD